jgi:hypothetical protein
LRLVLTEAKLRKYLKEWQPRLGLGHWNIKIEFGDVEAGNGAQCERSEFYDEATILVSDRVVGEDFSDHKPIDDFWFEKAIVHELLHCTMRDIVYVPAVINHALKKTERKALQAALQRAEEATVDRLAEDLVKSWRG